MAKVCHSCAKGPGFGNNRSHSMVATRRRFNPNLQKVRIVDKGGAFRDHVARLLAARQLLVEWTDRAGTAVRLCDETAVFGTTDQIAPPGSQEGVYYSLKRTGFKDVRLEKFFGGHALKSAEIQRALHWFRQLGKF